MIFTEMRTTIFLGLLCCGCLLAPGRLVAQAPAGPLPPSVPLPPPPKTAPAKKKPEIPSRTSLAGFWKLNKDESDDAKNKVEAARHSKDEPDGRMGPRVGVGYPGGGGPNGPYGGRGMDDHVDEGALRLEEFVRPAFTLAIDLKESEKEVDATNEQDTKLVMFTDGRKLPKQKDYIPQQILAHWDGAKLVTDEKSTQGKTMSRTFELSFDGKQINETWRIEGSKSTSDIIIRYVYDAAIDEHK